MSPGYIYQTSASLPPKAPSYVTRQADQQLYQELKAGNCCYVFNSRQMGKSSLRVRVTARLEQEGVAVALIDPQKIGTKLREDQWYAGVIKSLVQGLGLEPAFDFREWWRSLNEPPIPPVQRFTLFIETVLLRQIDCPIVIFVEEIDRLQSLPFPADDFFLLIRSLYEGRTQKPDLCRLTFALVGVTTPRDLIQDRNHSGFNIGTAIEMEGFTLAEAQPLAAGLADQVSDPQGVLRAVLHWSGGQPFLTQKLLGLVVREVEQGHPPDLDPATWVGQIAQQRIIDNWEAQDTPQHLRTLQDRMLQVSEQRRGRLLGLYQQILQAGGMVADDSYEQTHLRLTGLVVKRHGQLQVYNPVYRAVFGDHWVAQHLSELRPPFYTQALSAWQASADSDPSFLLRGQALEEAEAWAKDKRLSKEDEQFLQASQRYEKAEQEKELEAARKRNSLLAEANQIADRRIRRADLRNRWSLCCLILTIIAALGLIGAITIWGWKQKEQIGGIKENEIDRIIVLAKNLDRQFEVLQTQALVTAIQGGEQITKLSKILSLSKEEKKAQNSIEISLRNTLGKIQERQINARQGVVRSITWIEYNGESILASGGHDGTMRLWSRTGEPVEKLSDGSPIIIPTQQGGPVWSMNWSDETKKLATGGRDGTLKLWSLTDEDNLIFHENSKTIDTGRPAALSKVQWIKNGEYLLTLNFGRRLQLWLADGELHYNNEIENQQDIIRRITSFSWSEASQILATGGEDSTFKLWAQPNELQAGEIPESIPTFQDGAIWSTSWSQDGEFFATAGADGSVRLWTKQGSPFRLSHDENQNLGIFHPKNPSNINTGQGIVWYVVWTKGNDTLITGGADGSIKFWNLSDPSQPILKQSIQTLQGSISGMSLTQDETTLATIGTDETIKLWTLQKEPIDIDADTGDGNFEELSRLMQEGCDWLGSYLISSPEDLKTLPVCQTPELKRAASFNLIADSKHLARSGNLNKAIDGFTTAKEWNPSWPEDPETYARRIAAEAEN